MKRLVWLVLFAFCTAVAQVQPVDMPAKNSAACGCCEESGACGMPDCAPPPVTGQPAVVAEAPTVQRAEARRLTPAPRPKRTNFHATFGSRPAIAPACPAPQVAVAPLGDPLFRVHCSYLI